MVNLNKKIFQRPVTLGIEGELTLSDRAVTHYNSTITYTEIYFNELATDVASSLGSKFICVQMQFSASLMSRKHNLKKSNIRDLKVRKKQNHAPANSENQDCQF